MARSSYIYLITEKGCRIERPYAAFTVKHELETFLDKMEFKLPKEIRIYRLKDNPCWINFEKSIDITEEFIVGDEEFIDRKKKKY